MTWPRFRIRSLMVAVALVGVVLGLATSFMRVWDELGSVSIVIAPGPTIVIHEVPPAGTLALIILGPLVVGLPIGIYLLNRRRDRRRNRR